MDTSASLKATLSQLESVLYKNHWFSSIHTGMTHHSSAHKLKASAHTPDIARIRMCSLDVEVQAGDSRDIVLETASRLHYAATGEKIYNPFKWGWAER